MAIQKAGSSPATGTTEKPLESQWFKGLFFCFQWFAAFLAKTKCCDL
jgi:hypothetical protein